MNFTSALTIAAALLAPACAQAASLTVVNVAAPAVNCVFDSSCTVVVNDSTGDLKYSPLGKDAFLQSRTYVGKAGTPAAGRTAYVYRVALDQGSKDSDCLVGMVLDFGPVVALTYPQNQLAHVYVVTQGGVGSVGIKSADHDGNSITFSFDKPLCAGDTTYFFGLAAAGAPQNSTATLFGYGAPPFVQTAARVPTHAAALAPPQGLRVQP
ncbi:MAG TPA: hypothetical protein VFW22_01990 [Pseudolabrys sp.]|nr:hypothetical protein [Pseudolabrys sp.]